MQPASAGAASRTRPRLVAGIVAAAFFMQMLDGTIIATSLPAMAAHFGARPVDLNIGFTAYLLAMAIGIPPAGWLAGRYGPRRVFLAAIAIFTLASVACALAGSLNAFVAARIAQGLGGALMTPVGRQIVLGNTPRSGLVRAIALITWPALVAPVIGPVLGGWITAQAGWQWNFLLNLPLGALGLALTFAFIRDGEAAAPKPFDLAGFLASATALALVLIGLEELATGRAGPGLIMTAAGLVAGILCVWHLRRAPHPLIDLTILKTPTFAMSTLGAGTFARVAINGTPFILPLFLQVGLGLDAVAAGSWLLAYFLGNIAMKPAATWLMTMAGFRRLLVLNGLLAALSLAFLAGVDGATPGAVLAALLFVAGLTRSMQFTALNTIAFADVEPPARGAAATLSAMSQQMAQLLAIALSAMVIRLAELSGAEGLVPYRLAFCAMAVICLLSALRFLALEREAAAGLLPGRAHNGEGRGAVAARP